MKHEKSTLAERFEAAGKFKILHQCFAATWHMGNDFGDQDGFHCISLLDTECAGCSRLRGFGQRTSDSLTDAKFCIPRESHVTSSGLIWAHRSVIGR